MRSRATTSWPAAASPGTTTVPIEPAAHAYIGAMVIRVSARILEEDLGEPRVGAEVVAGETSCHDVIALVDTSCKVTHIVLEKVGLERTTVEG